MGRDTEKRLTIDVIVHPGSSGMRLVGRLDGDQITVVVVRKQDRDIIGYLKLGGYQLRTIERVALFDAPRGCSTLQPPCTSPTSEVHLIDHRHRRLSGYPAERQ